MNDRAYDTLVKMRICVYCEDLFCAVFSLKNKFVTLFNLLLANLFIPLLKNWLYSR